MVEIAGIEAEASIWEEIELCESYMVCSMNDDAASLASSVVERLRHCALSGGEDGEFYDMLESAGMVLVQSLKELGSSHGERTPYELVVQSQHWELQISELFN